MRPSPGAQAAIDRGCETYPIPVSPWNDVEIVGPFPLTAAEWERMLIILETMRPALVSEGPEVEGNCDISGGDSTADVTPRAMTRAQCPETVDAAEHIVQCDLPKSHPLPHRKGWMTWMPREEAS